VPGLAKVVSPDIAPPRLHEAESREHQAVGSGHAADIRRVAPGGMIAEWQPASHLGRQSQEAIACLNGAGCATHAVQDPYRALDDLRL